MKLRQAQATLKTSLVLLSLFTGPLWAGTEGTSSTFYGQVAGASGSSSSGSNTFVGYGAGASNSSGANNTFVGYGAGYYNTSSDNTFLGYHAGLFNASTGDGNTFLGYQAGLNNTSSYNTFLGRGAGENNTTGADNIFLGVQAGYLHTTGDVNTFLGVGAGYHNTSGQRNVFLGNEAGYSETGSNKLFIDNCMGGSPCTSPLIYGEFDNHLLKVNGVLNVRANSVAKSQMHFSQNDTDTGGFLTSVLDNNFFVSSGARYDGTAGGWTQRSSDTNAVIAGSGGVGYRIFTHTGSSVGATFLPTVRLHIDYSGQFGINIAPVAGHEIHTSSGAYLAGGTWTDASSRDYKARIAPLSGDAAAQTLAALNPVTFVYKSDAEQGHVGFIAEDVPDLVATRDRKGLSPMDIVAVLTKVVQEQKQTIEHQQAALALVQAQLFELAAEQRKMQLRQAGERP